MLNCSASLAMSTSVLKALPGKLNIKRHSPSIRYVSAFVRWLQRYKAIKNYIIQQSPYIKKPHTVTLRERQQTLNNRRMHHVGEDKIEKKIRPLWSPFGITDQVGSRNPSLVSPFGIKRLASYCQTVIMRDEFFDPILTWIMDFVLGHH